MEYLIVLNVIALSIAFAFWITPTINSDASDHDANRSNTKNISSTKKCSRCAAEMDAEDIICKNCGSLFNIFSKSHK